MRLTNKPGRRTGLEGFNAVYPLDIRGNAMKFNVILYNDFETIDAFGPVEVIGKLDRLYEIDYFSEKGGIVRSSQNVRVETLPLSGIRDAGIILGKEVAEKIARGIEYVWNKDPENDPFC